MGCLSSKPSSKNSPLVVNVQEKKYSEMSTKNPSKQPLLNRLTVKDNHQNLLNQGYKNNDKEDKIIEILGGIKQIKLFYKEFQDQITKIIRYYDEIAAEEVPIIGDYEFEYDEKKDADYDEIEEEPPTPSHWVPSTSSEYPTCSFNLNETFIHSLLNKDAANKYLKIIYSPYIAVLISAVIIFGIISFIFNYEVHTTNSLPWYILNLLSLITLSLYFISLMLSINKNALKVILRTFTFWFQLLYAIRLTVCLILYYYYVFPLDWISWIINSFNNIIWILAVIDISCLDAMSTSHPYLNILFGIFGASFFSIIAIIYTLQEMSQTKNDFDFNLFAHPFSINLVASIAYTSRVLSLFLWRQGLTPIFQPHTSALMKRRYQIKLTPLINIDKQTETDKFIDDLGGIDEIIKNYLNIRVDYLNEKRDEYSDDQQLRKINDILEDKLFQSKYCNINSVIKLYSSSKYNSEKVYFYFSRYNTCWHSWLGRKRGENIVNVLYGKVITGSIVVALIFSMVTSVINWDGPNLELLIIYLIYLLHVLLSMNKKTIKLTLCTFEFWLKTGYCIRWWLLRMIACSDGLEPGYSFGMIALEQLVWLLAIIFFSFMDGWAIKTRNKVILGIFAAAFFSLKTVWNTLIVINSTESIKWYHTFNVFGHKFTISLINWMTESAKITALICWKQSISAFLWRNNAKSVMIKRPCKIQWNDIDCQSLQRQ